MNTVSFQRFIPKTILFLSFLAAISTASTIFAHPPSGMKLSYDPAIATLHISMTHVTSNFIKHYIRKLEVYKNDQKALDLTLPKQTSPNSLARDVALTASPGDILRVKAVCKEGGTLEESLTIPEADTP